jgi:hypothetical protein
LPQTIIGRTCLKTYEQDRDGKHPEFPRFNKYDVNLYGLKLKVRSLPYQEQDTAVAACATTALWTCFHSTGKLFQHKIPAPNEITKWAEDYIPESPDGGARVFPNEGLTYAQMATAIRCVELEPCVDTASTRHQLNGVMYAYLRSKIPSILLTDLIDHKPGGNPEIERKDAQHAIVLSGFSLGDTRATGFGKWDFLLRASRIDRIYCHDDQVGPFAMMVWEKVSVLNGQKKRAKEAGIEETEWLATSWHSKEEDGSVFASPNHILLPLYHKIRIPYEDIHDAMVALDVFLEHARRKHIPELGRAEWDIFLTTANAYKIALREDYANSGVDLMRSLLTNLPRFLWRVMVRVDEELHLDLLFDATGIARHDLLVHVVSTGKAYAQILEATVPAFVKDISACAKRRYCHRWSPRTSCRPYRCCIRWSCAVPMWRRGKLESPCNR